MAVEGRCGDLLALGPPPEPSPAEGRWDNRELAAQIQFSILRGHSDTVSSCHFCYGDTKLLSCSYDKTVKLWVCCECNNKIKYLKAEIKRGMLYRQED